MEKRGQRGFEDLECYKLALQVLREAYRVIGTLPPEERYNLYVRQQAQGRQEYGDRVLHEERAIYDIVLSELAEDP